MEWYGYVLIAVAAVFLCWFVWFSNNKLTVRRVETEAENAPEEGLTIAHISDLHGKSFGYENGKLVDKLIAERPDLICITGDLIHRYDEKNLRAALSFASACAEIAPVYYVSGNHEMRSTRYRQLRKDLVACGVTVLDNRTVYGVASITGVNCACLKKGTQEKIVPVGGYKILLAHMPHFFDSYVRAGYDLVLSGHAHGGQWRIPFTGVGFYSPGQGLFPKYNSGVHKRGKTTMVISRGLGNSECPLRLFNLPELVIVKIKKK